MRDQILDVMTRVFRCPTSLFREDPTPDSVPGWDSAKHVEFVLALEEQFGCMFDADEIAELTSPAKVEALLTRHGCR